MNNQSDIIERYKLIRSRWDSEDSLLVSRTGVFLTANSIFFAASQLQKEPDPMFMIGVMIFSLVISFFWLTTSWHSFNVIARLYREARNYSPEAIKCIYGIDPVFVRPNTVFGKILPIVVIIAWIVPRLVYSRYGGLGSFNIFLSTDRIWVRHRVCRDAYV